MLSAPLAELFELNFAFNFFLVFAGIIINPGAIGALQFNYMFTIF